MAPSRSPSVTFPRRRPAADVLVVADACDAHAVLVLDELREASASATRLNLSDFATCRVTIGSGVVEIVRAGETSHITAATTTWWFRAGVPATTGLERLEADLVADELPAVLIGGLTAAGVRWVDSPDVVRTAELKAHQLEVARRSGAHTPRWLITNDPDEAHTLAYSTRIVAKALSSGIGIAPYVAEVGIDDLDSVSALPTFLQELIPATADLRVVVVNGHSWVWRRARGEDDPVDWRATDPAGTGFKLSENRAVGVLAAQITASLGLSMSVQDWLETVSGPVFLECNPQGAWAFLDNAPSQVVPSLTRFLLGRP